MLKPFPHRVQQQALLLLLLFCCALVAGCATPSPSMLAPVLAPVMALVHAANTSGESAPTVWLDAVAAESLSCRIGLNVSSFPEQPFYIDNFDLDLVQAGWYIDYRAAPGHPANNGAQYVMVVNVGDNDQGGYSYSPTGEELDETISAYPGGIYVIGNEPDRRELQNDVLPENYALLYHDVYQEIKSKDPTAKVWAGAIVQPTPLRLKYLDRVLAAYQARFGTPMPVDGWAIHSFLLNERDCDAYNNELSVCWGAEIPPGLDETDGIVLTVQDNARTDLFMQGIERFRSWMANNGYRNTPLQVTEYGVLMPPSFGFPPGVVNRYMRDTFDYMLNTTDEEVGNPADGNRLVQRFAWFSTFEPRFNGEVYQSVEGGDSMTPPFVITSIGTQFRDLVAAEEESSDLAVLSLRTLEGPQRLEATIGNSGNRLTATKATVRFYTGGTLEGARVIGDVTVNLAGCGATSTVTIAWEGLEDAPPGRYRVWAEILQSDFADDNEENNTLSHDAFVNGLPLYLPMIDD